MDLSRKQRELYRHGMEQAYDVIYNICSVSLQSTLRNTETFEEISENSDALELLSLIHNVMLTPMELEDMGVMIILGADNKRYSILKQELLNDYS